MIVNQLPCDKIKTITLRENNRTYIKSRANEGYSIKLVKILSNVIVLILSLRLINDYPSLYCSFSGIVLVCYAAVFIVVTQRSSPPCGGRPHVWQLLLNLGCL